jgi:uncharacterized protein (TIGR02996 family)
MSDGKALLAVIWEHPHEDTPRLVYADWLQETGKPVNVARAEFIRVQCELARLDEDDPKRPVLEKRERSLLRKHQKDWIKDLPKPLTHAGFARGFVYPRMRGLRGNQFLALNESDLALAPLWSFRIELAAKVWPRVASSPSLERIDQLDLGNNRLDEAAAVLLLGCKQLVNVSKLGLGLSQFTPAALTALANNNTLVHLKELVFCGNDLTDETFAPLASSPRLATVQTLGLPQNELTAVSMRALAQSPYTTRLRSLDMSSNPLGDEGIRELCQSSLRLRDLNLHLVGMTDASSECLAKWPGLQSLRYLTFGTPELSVVTAKAFAASPHFRDDVVITCWHTRLGRDKASTKLLRDRFGENIHF